MNILPKKRWHVRTKENIARVRRDEANAAKEQKELERRIQLASQEARIALLRANRQKSVKEEHEEKESSSLGRDKHINFFSEIEEAGGYFGGGSKEHAAEKKAEQDKFEQKIGLLTYLGQDIPSETAWYVKSPGERVQEHDEEKDRKRKQLDDPIHKMNEYLKRKKGNEDEGKTNKIKEYISTKSETTESSGQKSKPKDKLRKEKSIEELRAERLLREKEERLRAEELIRKHKGLDAKVPDTPLDERYRRYNSQFNPHLARQSRTDL